MTHFKKVYYTTLQSYKTNKLKCNHSHEKFIELLEGKRSQKYTPYLYTQVHSSIICNSQKVEATHMSMDTDKLWYIHNTMEYHSILKKDRNSDIC